MSDESSEEKELEESKRWPFEARFGSKKWKIRSEAYKNVAKELEDETADAPIIKEIAPFITKALADSNVNSQALAVQALIALLRVVEPDTITKYAESWCNALVQKVISQKKSERLVNEAMLFLVELDYGDKALDALFVGCKHKMPKFHLPCISVIRSIVVEFGMKPFKVETFKALPELCDHKDSNVRSEAKSLIVLIAAWSGKARVESLIISKIGNSTAKSEIQEAIEKLGAERPQASRVTRSFQGAPDAEEDNNTTDSADIEDDNFNECEAYDVLEKLGKLKIDVETKDADGKVTDTNQIKFWGAIESSVWSVKVEALRKAIEVCNCERFSAGDYGELSKRLKALVTDINVSVATEASRLIERLAIGLRTDFASGAKLVLSGLLDRLKEKKPVLVRAVQDALSAVGKNCIKLSDIASDVLSAALQHKVPKVRQETLKWVVYCFQMQKPVRESCLEVFQAIGKTVSGLMADANPDVRSSALEALSEFGKVLGVKESSKYIKDDDSKLSKLREKVGNQKPAASSTNSESHAASERVKADAKVAPSERKRPSTASVTRETPSRPSSRPKSAVPPRRAESKKHEKPAKSKNTSEEPVQISLPDVSNEELCNRLEKLFERDVLNTILTSSAWKERKAAWESVGDIIRVMQEKPQVDDLMTFICQTILEERNAPVFHLGIQTVTMLLSKECDLGLEVIYLVIAKISSKFDVKNAESMKSILLSLCEIRGPSPVYAGLNEFFPKAHPRAPKEILSVSKSILEEFSPTLVPAVSVMSIASKGLACTSPDIRTEAISLIGKLHSVMGSSIRQYIPKDLAKGLPERVENALSANPYEQKASSDVPRRSVRGQCVNNTENLSTQGERRDISGSLAKPMQLMKMSKWSDKKSGLDSLTEILENANFSILPEGIPEIVAQLKALLGDTNKNVVAFTLKTVGDLVSALGPACEKCCKPLLPEIVKSLSDNKKQASDAAGEALRKWSEQLPLEKLVVTLEAGMGIRTKSGKVIPAEGRQKALDVAADAAGRRQPPGSSALANFINPASLAIVDKHPGVRASGERLAKELIRVCGVALLRKSMSTKPKGVLEQLLLKSEESEKAKIASENQSDSKDLSQQKKIKNNESDIPADTAKVRGTNDNSKVVPVESNSVSDARTEATSEPINGHSNGSLNEKDSEGENGAIKPSHDELPGAVKDHDSRVVNSKTEPSHYAEGNGRANSLDISLWQRGKDLLSSSDPIEGLKVITTIIEDVVAGTSPLQIQAVADEIDSLLSKMKKVIDLSMFKLKTSWQHSIEIQSVEIKLAKYVLNTLVQIFQVPELASRASLEHVESIVDTVLITLQDQNTQRLGESDAILKALNILVLKILQCCNSTFCLCALLNLAGKCEAFTNPEDYQYGHLVTRCLQKFINLLSDANSKAIDLTHVFHYFKRLFNDTWGPSEIQARRTTGDRTFYMVARLLKTVVISFSEAIESEHQWLIRGEDGFSVYLGLLLERHRIGQGLDSPSNTAQFVASSSSLSGANANISPTSANSVLTEKVVQSPQDPDSHTAPKRNSPSPNQSPLRIELSSIFRQIGNRETLDSGIRSLYFFMRRHPEIDISQHLERTSEQFKEFIKERLQKVDRMFRNNEIEEPNLNENMPSQSKTDQYQVDARKSGGVTTLDSLRARMDRLQAMARKTQISNRERS